MGLGSDADSGSPATGDNISKSNREMKKPKADKANPKIVPPSSPSGAALNAGKAAGKRK
jgi:hypothetical protein